MNEWQPIATAPKDGRLVAVVGLEPGDLGYTADRTNVTVARWDGVCWNPTLSGGRYYHGIYPTHWFPLPELPRPSQSRLAGKALLRPG
jgi:hypothetical protein